MKIALLNSTLKLRVWTKREGCQTAQNMKPVRSPNLRASITCIWASSQDNLSSVFANNKGADQTAHPRSLISAFVIRSLERIIYRLATSEISIFYLVSLAEQDGLNHTLSETVKTGFLAKGYIVNTRTKSLRQEKHVPTG